MNRCQICNKKFTPKSHKARNCDEHKGLFHKNWSVGAQGVLIRRCSKCSNWLSPSDFYRKYTGAKAMGRSSWCRYCFTKHATSYLQDRGTKRKKQLIEIKGGKCQVCGYNKNFSALVFHHRDTSTKTMTLDSRHLSGSSMEKILAELDKCDLLCHNCHTEIHFPDNIL